MPLNRSRGLARKRQTGCKAHNRREFPALRSLLIPLPGGRVIDLVDPTRTSSYDAAIDGYVSGFGRYTANHADGISSIHPKGACGYQKFSRIAILRQNVMGGTVSDSADSSATGGAQWIATTTGEMTLNKANTIAIGTSSGMGMAAGQSYVIGVTYDGATVKHFRDGKQYGSTAAAETFTIEAVARIFSRGGAGSEQLNGALGLHADFEGALSESVMLALTLNPMQLLAPEYRHFSSAASSETTLVLTDITHGHTLDAVSLTQTHNLAQADIAHGHTLDAVSLTQDHNLGLADVVHAHSLDAVALTQAHNLALADVSHAHVLDNVVLDSALLVSDIAHGHTADSVSLTQTHNLSIASISHAHTLDVVGFGSVLVVADIAHGFSLDNIIFPPLWSTVQAASGVWTAKPLSGGTWTEI